MRQQKGSREAKFLVCSSMSFSLALTLNLTLTSRKVFSGSRILSQLKLAVCSLLDAYPNWWDDFDEQARTGIKHADGDSGACLRLKGSSVDDSRS